LIRSAAEFDGGDDDVFFNVGLRCWNIQKASWFAEISWNWNRSSANGKWPILLL
jgi:hypothetical protein